ncbi:NeuD/PglB/VioB family sugar acetyltransferase [[Clostridium] innocuum]|nr:NeuD/PglB/VioB family sugar acetyltransferase [[Clostridium] innocuum]
MKDIIMIGSGGCMRELAWQILEDNKYINKWNILGYVDDNVSNSKDLYVGDCFIPYLGNDDYIINTQTDLNIVVSIGSSQLRYTLVSKYCKNSYVHFPNIILNSAKVCDDLKIGKGCIIAMDARISTNIEMGNFVFANTGSLICHDGVIGDFVTISPRSQVAGNVNIGPRVEIGMNASIIQSLNIKSDVIIGAGATVIEDIKEKCTVVGVPARKIGE